MKEKLRIKSYEIVTYPVPNLMCMLIGKDIINNPNIVRRDDIETGDVVFYESLNKRRTN